MKPVIILRPAPGASETAARAAAMGLPVRLCPLFEARAIDWDAPPPERFDALLLTSAQGPRLAGPQLAHYRGLSAYAVGKTTARALEEQGFTGIIAGEQDGAAIAARIEGDGHKRVLHLGGTTVAPWPQGSLSVERIAVYTVREAADADPQQLFEPGAVILVHSPRAGQRLSELVPADRRPELHLVAISAAALAACGTDWASVEAPDRPEDERMLALALRLCE